MTRVHRNITEFKPGNISNIITLVSYTYNSYKIYHSPVNAAIHIVIKIFK